MQFATPDSRVIQLNSNPGRSEDRKKQKTTENDLNSMTELTNLWNWQKTGMT